MARKKEENIEDILDRIEEDIMTIKDKMENQDDEDLDGEEDFNGEEDDSDSDGW
mgnify:FL=1